MTNSAQHYKQARDLQTRHVPYLQIKNNIEVYEYNTYWGGAPTW